MREPPEGPIHTVESGKSGSEGERTNLFIILSFLHMGLVFVASLSHKKTFRRQADLKSNKFIPHINKKIIKLVKFFNHMKTNH